MKDKVLTDIDIANIEKPRVPAITYFYVRECDNKIVGMINIRLALNDFLKLSIIVIHLRVKYRRMYLRGSLELEK